MIKVRNILADGREVDDIDGYVVPNSGETAAIYNFMADFVRKHPEYFED